jgi:hypothetical protein
MSLSAFDLTSSEETVKDLQRRTICDKADLIMPVLLAETWTPWEQVAALDRRIHDR